LFCESFPSFKAKVDSDTLFLQVCHFISTPKLQMEKQAFVLNRNLITNHQYYNFSPSRKWLGRLYSCTARGLILC
jgi:hypothetical protein